MPEVRTGVLGEIVTTLVLAEDLFDSRDRIGV
jgi:hypothetical protein